MKKKIIILLIVLALFFIGLPMEKFLKPCSVFQVW